MESSRVKFLRTYLAAQGKFKAVETLNWMVEEFSTENGFQRMNGDPYYLHLVEVTLDLINHGINDEETIIVALLHDSLEDIPSITHDVLTFRYNKEIADYVQALTKDKSIDYKVDISAMKAYINNIAKSVVTARVKASDRVHNVSTLDFASNSHIQKQFTETTNIFIPFYKECRKKFPQNSDYFEHCKKVTLPILAQLEINLAKDATILEQGKEIKLLKNQLSDLVG